VTPIVRTAINRNKRVYKKWIQRGRISADKHHVNVVQKKTNKIIKDAKQEYIDNLSAKICDPRSGGKVFWSAYKRLINKKKNTNIPPILGDDTHLYPTSIKKLKYLKKKFTNNAVHSILNPICLHSP
jgi:hypothetical protein